MMFNQKYSVDFTIALATVLFLAGCSSFFATQDPEKKAFEVAHDACGIFRRMGIEQVNNDEAVLETWGESTVSKVWVVRLSGTWKSVGDSVPTIETSSTPNSSLSSSGWLVVCEVSISS